jgi:hypothetical protein
VKAMAKKKKDPARQSRKQSQNHGENNTAKGSEQIKE